MSSAITKSLIPHHCNSTNNSPMSFEHSKCLPRIISSCFLHHCKVPLFVALGIRYDLHKRRLLVPLAVGVDSVFARQRFPITKSPEHVRSLTVHNSISTLGRVANVVEIPDRRSQRIYPGSGLWEGVIPSVLFCVCIHGGMPRARVTMGMMCWLPRV